jgi:hypothetical protein
MLMHAAKFKNNRDISFECDYFVFFGYFRL